VTDDGVLIAVASAPVVLGVLLYLFFGRYRLHQRPRQRALIVGAGNALFVLFAVSVIVLSGECYYRYLYDASDAYAMARTGKAWLDRHWITNRWSYRDSEDLHGLDRPVTERRVNFLGDSFTAGYGVADVERRFANLIRRRHRDDRWQVDVFAGSGWDTGDEVVVLSDIQRQGYEFDRFVLVYNINDVADMLPLRDEIVQRASTEPPALFDHSFFLNMLWVRWTVAHDPVLAKYYSSLPAGYEGTYWEQQKTRLRTIKMLVERNHGRFLVVTFPFLTDLGPRYPYRDIHAKLDAFWRQLSVPVLDLLGVMEAHPDEQLFVSYRDPHPNERAHELAAGAIDSFVVDQMRSASNQ
jgi:hypothetical protein